MALIGFGADKSVLVHHTVCSDENEACMNNYCAEWSNKSSVDPANVTACIVKYYQWERVDNGVFTSTKCM